MGLVFCGQVREVVNFSLCENILLRQLDRFALSAQGNVKPHLVIEL